MISSLLRQRIVKRPLLSSLMSTSLADYKTENGVHTEALQRKLRAEGERKASISTPRNRCTIKSNELDNKLLGEVIDATM